MVHRRHGHLSKEQTGKAKTEAEPKQTPQDSKKENWVDHDLGDAARHRQSDD
jgi:hypothetical protein